MEKLGPVEYAIPFFILLIVVEMIWARRNAPTAYEPRDTLTSLALGVGSTMVGALTAGLVAAAAGARYAATTFLRCLDESVGVFVSAQGDDKNAGTRKSPVKTVSRAQELQGAKPRIYVCEGEYAGNVVLKRTTQVMGGFDCGEWKLSGKLVRLVATSSGEAVRVEDVGGAGVALWDVSIEAKAGDVTNANSVGVFARNSVLKLYRVSVKAADGAPADAGTLHDSTRPLSAPSCVKITDTSAGSDPAEPRVGHLRVDRGGRTEPGPRRGGIIVEQGHRPVEFAAGRGGFGHGGHDGSPGDVCA